MKLTCRRFLMLGCLLGWLVLLGLQSIAGEAPGKTEPIGKGKLETVTYDVEDLVLRSATWRKGVSATWPKVSNGRIPDGIEGVVHVIATRVDPECWGGKNKENTIQEKNGQKLDIQATKAQHAQIVDLLAALRQLADCAVVIEAWLYEVDEDFYKKELEPVLRRGKTDASDPAVALLERAASAKLHTHGKLSAENKVTIANRQAARFFSQRNAFSYRTTPEAGHVAPTFGTGFHGFSCRAAVTVSPDRRSVEMKIERTVTELIDIRKDTVLDPETEKKIPIDIPNLRDFSATATVEVEDGEYALVPIPYRPASLAKDRVLVVIVRSVIYIEEEELIKKGIKKD